MKKILIYILFLALISSIALAETNEITTNGFDPYVKIYYPDTIPAGEPFDLKIDFVDRKIAKNFESLRFTFTPPLEYVYGEKEYPYPIEYQVNKYGGGRFAVKYNGEKSMTLPVVNRGRSTSATIEMHNPKEDLKIYDETRLRFESIPYEESLQGIPEGFKEVDGEVFDYKKESETEKAGFVIETLFIPFSPRSIVIPTDELLTFKIYNFFTIHSNWRNYDNSDKTETYEFESEGKDGKIYYKCWIYDNSNDHLKTEEYTLECNYAGILIKDYGVVGIDGKAKINKIPDKTTLQTKEEYYRNLIKNILIRHKQTQKNSVEKVKIEERTDLCGECKEGYVCGACGECIRETKAYDPKRVKTKVELDIENNNEKILDTIESNLAFRVIPEIEITYGDEKVDYCSLKAPGLSMEIKGKRLENDSYSGFTSGFPTDEREEESDCEVDFQEPKCVFIVSPSDEKKFFKEAEENVEQYQFTASIKEKDIKEKAKVTLVPPKKFELELDSKGVQVQQGNMKVLEITAKGGTTENIIIKATLMGPGKVGLSSKNIKREWVIDSIREGEILKLGYRAPSMGNFDIGQELASLSMVDLQKQAAKQIAIDAVTSYAGDYVGEIDDLADAGRITKEAGHVAKEYKAIDGVRNLKGVHDSVTGTADEVGDASRINEGKKDATWAERAADVGIVGISAAQTAVSTLSFYPEKIPYVGKLSAGFNSAFSAATNIWKANLQYISKSEKISRAQELYYPVAILVTAQDISGWTTQEMQIFKIAYHKIK
ncbi:MAG: hypothetical protein ACQESF_04600 [Nanobdellota archaeon]